MNPLPAQNIWLEFALDSANIGAWDLDLATHTIRRTLRYDQIFGYSSLLPLWTYEIFLSHIHPEDRGYVSQAFKESLEKGTDWIFECRIIRADKTEAWIGGKGKSFATEDGQPYHVFGLIKDITKKKQIEENLQLLYKKLDILSQTDYLTGLANRAQFTQRLQQIIKDRGDDSQHNIFVLFLDLDKFKLINDTLGHETGDILLQTVAKRLIVEVKNKDKVARFGGDEFAILLDNVADVTAAIEVVKRILNKIKEPIRIDQRQLFITSSIGVSSFPENADDEQTLLKYADIAMYSAKQAGRDNYCFFTAEMAHNVRDKIDMENILREALNEKKFILHYQPQIDLKTGNICGIEVLLRLPKSDNSLILPKDFIPTAEEMGLIIPLGEWVIKNSCEQYKKWEEGILNTKKNLLPVKLAVNLSAHQLTDPGFLKMLEEILNKTGMNPHNLELEITESPIIEDIEQGAKVIRGLKEMGISIALDDFGIGYSSLNYLRQFRIDTLKLDQSLIQNVYLDKNDAAIIIAIIDMAHVMGITIVAEGAENEEQLQFLIRNQCDKVQSNFFSKPVTAENVIALIEEQRHWIWGRSV